MVHSGIATVSSCESPSWCMQISVVDQLFDPLCSQLTLNCSLVTRGADLSYLKTVRSFFLVCKPSISGITLIACNRLLVTSMVHC